MKKQTNTKQYTNCTSISTKNNEIEIGKKYQFFENFPLTVYDVILLEDNSTNEMINLKLEIIKQYKGHGKIGEVFDVSMINESISFSGMWKLYEENTYPY